MYKSLFFDALIESQASSDEYYTIEDLFDYITSDEYLKKVEYLKYTSVEIYIENYLKNLNYLKNHGLPKSTDEQFNFSDLKKLFAIELLDKDCLQSKIDNVSLFEHLMDSGIVLTDGRTISNHTFHKNFKDVKIYECTKQNFSRIKDYLKFVKNTNNFSNFTYAVSRIPDILSFSKNSQKFAENAFKIRYLNSTDEPTLESNCLIVDIKEDSVVSLDELVTVQAGQCNFVTYILRSNSTLYLNRSTTDMGGWSIFDSKIICHPGSKIVIDNMSAGANYCQDNFYFECSNDVSIFFDSRNPIKKGNQYHTYIEVISSGPNNTVSVNSKIIGDEFTKTSFVGKYLVDKDSIGFNGDMINSNLMLSNTAKMHTRPILDIHTKEIACSHGCTISNVDENQLYYLETKGFSPVEATDILVDNFLC